VTELLRAVFGTNDSDEPFDPMNVERDQAGFDALKAAIRQ
jgi:hypothetical protein